MNSGGPCDRIKLGPTYEAVNQLSRKSITDATNMEPAIVIRGQQANNLETV